MQNAVLPIFLFTLCVVGLAVTLLIIANLFNPLRPGSVKRMPYESGMDPFHDTHRRFDVRFHLLAIAFLVFDVELLFLYPWAVALRPALMDDVQASQTINTEKTTAPRQTGIDAAVASNYVENRHIIFAGAMIFIILLTLGFIYDWRKGIFQWH